MLKVIGTVVGLIYIAMLAMKLFSGPDNMFADGNTWVIPVVFSLSLAGLSMWSSTKVTPWNSLCDTYPVLEEYQGKWLGFQTMKFGPILNFASCVTMGFSPTALNLKLWGFPFSKKMQIPWSNIHEIREESMGLYSNIQFVLNNGEPLTFFYSEQLKSVMAKVIPAIGQSHLLKGG
jgi:hypothetical protein